MTGMSLCVLAFGLMGVSLYIGLQLGLKGTMDNLASQTDAKALEIVRKWRAKR